MTASDPIRIVLGDEDECVKTGDATEDYYARVAAVRKKLEAEYGVPFRDVTIGRGAAGTGFTAVLEFVLA